MGSIELGFAGIDVVGTVGELPYAMTHIVHIRVSLLLVVRPVRTCQTPLAAALISKVVW
jgi:hypothetical protein